MLTVTPPAFVPDCTSDIFVSYAHRDDPAWVSAFQSSLQEAVAQRLGSDVVTWQDDEQIRAGENWQEKFEAAVSGAATLVAVSSPSYANSEWCTRERKLFAKRVDLETGGRFFIALKTPWPDDGHKDFLPKIKAVAFSREKDGAELVPGTRDFADSITSLANGVASTLLQMRRGSFKVFVASPADDCLDAWKDMGTQLRKLGCDVQPPGRRDAAFADALVVREMKGASLSVHLLGASYDEFALRQIRLCTDLGDPPVLCLLQDEESLHPLQKAVVARMRAGLVPGSGDQELPKGWRFLKYGSPRRMIEEVVQLLDQKKAVAEPPSDGRRSVYIVHDATTPTDADIARVLQEELSKRESMTFNLLRPDGGSSGRLRERHDALLRSCDGVLLCRDAAPGKWFDEMAPEVLFPERRFERTPPRSLGLLRSQASVWDEIKVPNLSVIPYRAPVQLSDLEGFLAPLRS
jgi:hypothetical protein